MNAAPSVGDSLPAYEKAYFCKVQLGLEIWDWSEVRWMCEGQSIQTDAIFSHILDYVCVCSISAWPVWPGGGVYDKPLSLLSVSSQPDIYPKHSHNVMGTNPLYTSSASSEWYRQI